MAAIPMHNVIILNPQAKRGRAESLCASLNGMTRDFRVLKTTEPEDAILKASLAVAEGAKIIIAGGGDGTINEVVNGLIGSDCALGILPLGSVNVLARQLKIPFRLEDAWAVIREGYVQSVDLIKIKYQLNREAKCRYFIQLAGVGMDAKAVQRVTGIQKKKWGPLSYIIEFLKILHHDHPQITININGTSLKGIGLLIGNGNYYGGPFNVFRRASMTDGLMDLCVCKSLGYFRLLAYMFWMARGNLEKARGIVYQQASEVEITSLEEIPVEIDGEFLGYLPARLTVVPNALKVIVPRNKGDASAP